MKQRFYLLLCLLLSSCVAFSQGDPLQKFFKQRDFKAIELKLTPEGQARYEKEKKDFLSVKDAQFTIAPNLVMNRTLKAITGAIQPTGNNAAEIKAQNDMNKVAAVAAEKYFKLKKFAWNKYYLADFGDIWQNLPLGFNCSFNSDVLTPVKDQGSCGSCWAFAAAATWEHAHKKVFGAFGYNESIDVSEEDMVNCGTVCNNGGDCGSCEGGHTFKAFSHLTCYKGSKEADYPYTHSDRTCLSKPKSISAYGFGQIGSNASFPSTDEIKAAINMYGAVTSYVFVGTGWYGYDRGTLNAIPSGQTMCKDEKDNLYSCPDGINHAVTIVGWCNNSWIIKNSWGTGWGSYGGYAYVAFNTYNIGKYVYYVFPQF